MDLYDRVEKMTRYLRRLDDAVRESQGMDAVRALGIIREEWAEIGWAMAQLAFDQGHTKKSIALALDMPASMLRGMKKTPGFDNREHE
jgi:hypothetical protein